MKKAFKKGHAYRHYQMLKRWLERRGHYKDASVGDQPHLHEYDLYYEELPRSKAKVTTKLVRRR